MQKIDAIDGTLGALARMSSVIAGAVYGCCSKRQEEKHMRKMEQTPPTFPHVSYH
jgi:hypothetical protein